MGNRLHIETTSFSLHLFAMALMLCDHLWGTIVPGNDWMTCIGRIAFPLFAFLLAEGYARTGNRKKYAKRLLLVALLSELPFNLTMSGSFFNPLQQNVLWTFLIAFAMMVWNDWAKGKGKLWLRLAVALLSIAVGFLLGTVAFVDYHGPGVLTVLVFYFLRQRTWWAFALQLLCLGYINLEMLGGLVYEIPLWGETVVFHRQGFALLALLPIWLYRGKQGYHSKKWQYVCYAFYPVHLLLLGILGML